MSDFSCDQQKWTTKPWKPWLHLSILRGWQYPRTHCAVRKLHRKIKTKDFQHWNLEILHWPQNLFLHVCMVYNPCIHHEQTSLLPRSHKLKTFMPSWNEVFSKELILCCWTSRILHQTLLSRWLQTAVTRRGDASTNTILIHLFEMWCCH